MAKYHTKAQGTHGNKAMPRYTTRTCTDTHQAHTDTHKTPQHHRGRGQGTQEAKKIRGKRGEDCKKRTKNVKNKNEGKGRERRGSRGHGNEVKDEKKIVGITERRGENKRMIETAWQSGNKMRRSEVKKRRENAKGSRVRKEKKYDGRERAEGNLKGKDRKIENG